jgi:hypothetical protein
MAKRILVVLLMVLLAGGIIGWVVWNKPHPKAEDEKASAIAADSLYNAFVQNEQAANTHYLNKVLELQGSAAELSRNQDGQQVLILSVPDPLGGVQCTMRKDQPAVAQGQAVRIKGFCNGYTSVVLLSDCVLVK